MSMSSSQVYEMAQKLNESKVDTIPEVESKDNVSTELNETTVQTENKEVVDEAPDQETVVESSEKVESHPTKEVPTKEEKEKYAFTKLKNKERQKRERLINDYETKIKTLNDELAKFKDLKKDSFNSDEDYVDYLVSRKMKEQETSRLEIAKANAEAEAFDEINQQRIMNCFPDEKDRESYNRLIQTSAKPFVELLEKADPDNAILSYLDDCEIAPLLIRVMMTKPEYRNEILSKKNPYSKVMAIDNLAKRLSYAKSVIDKRRSSSTEQVDEKKTKPSMPVVGRVAKSESSTQIDKSSPNYWNEKLKELNQARGR